MYILVSLEHLIPANNIPVCPGEVLSYICTATGDALAWQESGGQLFTFNSPDQINSTKQGETFTFLLIDAFNGVTASVYTFISNATIGSTSSDNNDILISCSDGSTILSKNVVVAGMLLFCFLL